MKTYKQRSWTKKEEDFIKNNFTVLSRQEMADHLSRGFYSIHRRMQKLGLKKNESSRKELIGKKFGKFTVVRFIKTDNKRSYFEVLCDCGVIKILQHTNFTLGNSKSCGCKRYDNVEYNQYNSYYKQYKNSAKKRELNFDLSFESFKKIILKNCYYCNVEPRKMIHRCRRKDSPLKNSYILTNGIDRLKNDIGYLESNCVPCCPTCNFMKQEHSDDIFLQIVSKIHNNRNLKINIDID